jgi:multiple sugar transport system permease protein
MIKSSLIGLADIFQMPPKILPTKVHLSNYVTALSQYPFHKFFWNSCIITGLTVLGAVITSSMCAFAFSRLEWKWRDQIFYLILSGLMLPFFVVMIPQFMGWNALGQIDSFIPLIAPAWFGGGVFNIFLLRQFFLGVPKELDEAARVDGASYFRIYWQIIMPLSKQALIVVGLLTYLVSWNDYLAPMIYLSSQENYTLMLGLNLFLGSYSAQWNYMMAATSIIVIPSLIIFLFAQKHFIEGISMSGLKG